MRKGTQLIIGLSLLVLLGIIKVFNTPFRPEYHISIANDTNQLVRDLTISYQSGGVVIHHLSQLPPNESWNYTLETQTLPSENAVILTYKDYQGHAYREYLVGYLEKGYRGKAKVSIQTIDETGKLEMKITE